MPSLGRGILSILSAKMSATKVIPFARLGASHVFYIIEAFKIVECFMYICE